MTDREKKSKSLTPTQAKARAQYYCAYQERSQQEVRDKIYSWGLHKKDVENLIATLIEDNYLNEERFANAYVSGKFRINNWGRNKIIQGLKAKNVSENLIKSALKSLDEEEYVLTVEKQATKKWESTKDPNIYSRKQKTYTYLLSKGYEHAIIQEVLERISTL